MSELEWYQWPLIAVGLAAAFITAFSLWFLFGIFVLPIGCALTGQNLYRGWTKWCFYLEFLGSDKNV